MSVPKADREIRKEHQVRFSSQLTRGVLLTAAAGTAVAGIAACSSNNSSSNASASASTSASTSSASPTSTGTTSPTSCTISALSTAVPGGGTVIKYACGNTGSKEIAAVKYNPGGKTVWMYVNKDQWQADDSIANQVCGTASAGLPQALLDMCPSATPSPSASKSKK